MYDIEVVTGLMLFTTSFTEPERMAFFWDSRYYIYIKHKVIIYYEKPRISSNAVRTIIPILILTYIRIAPVIIYDNKEINTGCVPMPVVDANHHLLKKKKKIHYR